MNQALSPDTADVVFAPPGLPSGPEPLRLRDVVKIIRRNMWLLLAVVLVITLPAGWYISGIPPVYTASGTIMVGTSEPAIVDPASLLANMQIDSVIVNSELAVLRSPAIAETVIRDTGVLESPEFNPFLEIAATAPPEAPAGLDPAPQSQPPAGDAPSAALAGDSPSAAPAGDSPSAALAGDSPSAALAGDSVDPAIIENFLGSLSVWPVDRSRAIMVQFTSRDPQLARRVVDALMTHYLSRQVDTRTQVMHDVGSWLSQRLTRLQGEVKAKEEAVEAFKSGKGSADGRDLALINAQITEVSTELARAQSEAAAAQARRDRAQAAVKEGGVRAVLGVSSTSVADTLRDQETRLRRDLADLDAYGDRHPRLIKLRSEAGAVAAQIDREARNLLSQIDSGAKVATERARSLEATLASLQNQIRTIGAASADLRSLERDAEASRLVLQTFLQRNEELEQGRINLPDAWVVSNAFVSPRPSGMSPLILMLGVTAGSFAMGLMGVAGRELVRRGLSSHEDVRQALGRPCFGVVPYISGSELKGRRPQDYVLDDCYSAYAEALKHLFVSITLAAGHHPGGKVVVVTSAVPGEGKSTLVASLGRLSAAVEYRVLVIDADLRKPAIAQLLQTTPKAGLAEYLEGQIELAQTLQVDTRSGLSFIPAGSPSLRASALLQSERMAALLDEASRAYDLVVIDVPPVLAVSDARVLAGQADVTLLTVHWLATKRSVVKLAMEQLEQAGVQQMGIVLSLVDLDKAGVYGSESMEYLAEVRDYGDDAGRGARGLPPRPGPRPTVSRV